MKILHTSDLHIGKRVSEYPMLEEQEFIFKQIVDIAKEEQPDAIILAGDIYDKSVPSTEAVSLFDDFLVSLSKLDKAIFVISGNHDSEERVSFASRIMKSNRIFLSPVYNGDILPILLDDQEGTRVAFYMVPFLKPSMVLHYAPEDVEIKTFDTAMRYVINNMNISDSCRNVLITHQFVTGAERSESEDIMVGNLDNIDASVFDKFDYVALGHLHRPQSCGRETIRYSGSPLKYSFSEVNDKKSVSIVEIKGKNEATIKERYLTPLHDWYDLRGTYEELTSKEFYDGKDYQEAYIRITLTDEDDITDGKRKLQTIYHRLAEFRYDNKRTRAGMTMIDKPMNVDRLDPGQIFGELFEKQNAQKLSDKQNKYLNGLIDQIFNSK